MHRFVRLLSIVLLTVGLAGVGSASAGTSTQIARTQAPTNPSGFLRVSHLAPQVGAVTVSLTSPGGAEQILADAAPYGAVTKYATVAPGEYTLAMRPAGEPATSPPLLSATLRVEPGQSYTVLATGRPDALVTRVVQDELTPPGADKALVRLIQGSPSGGQLTFTAVDGPVLARNVAYGTATGYGEVPAGRWTLNITAADGSKPVGDSPVVDLGAGCLLTLLVTDAPGGGYTVTNIVDAQGMDMSVTPVGGVETGGGGAAARGATGPAAVLVGAVTVAGAAAALVLRRRPGHGGGGVVEPRNQSVCWAKSLPRIEARATTPLAKATSAPTSRM